MDKDFTSDVLDSISPPMTEQLLKIKRNWSSHQPEENKTPYERGFKDCYNMLAPSIIEAIDMILMVRDLKEGEISDPSKEKVFREKFIKLRIMTSLLGFSD